MTKHLKTSTSMIHHKTQHLLQIMPVLLLVPRTTKLQCNTLFAPHGFSPFCLHSLKPPLQKWRILENTICSNRTLCDYHYTDYWLCADELNTRVILAYSKPTIALTSVEIHGAVSYISFPRCVLYCITVRISKCVSQRNVSGRARSIGSCPPAQHSARVPDRRLHTGEWTVYLGTRRCHCQTGREVSIDWRAASVRRVHPYDDPSSNRCIRQLRMHPLSSARTHSPHARSRLPLSSEGAGIDLQEDGVSHRNG